MIYNMKNKSKIYGNYGGVSNENFYVPPGSPNFVPKPELVSFTDADKQNLERIAANTEFYKEHAKNIMLRTSVSVGTKDTFTITTSANPADKIVYTTDKNGIDLNVVDGGFF